MQGKGIVKFFTYFLLVVSVYQLLLLIPTNRIEKAAAKYASAKANGAPADMAEVVRNEAEQNFLDSASNKTALNLGLAKFSYSDLKKQQIGLGLDLQGGMSATLQVDLMDFLKALSNQNATPEFSDALRKAKEMQTSSDKDFVTLFGEAYTASGKKLASVFAANPSLKIDVTASDADVLKVIRKMAKETVATTHQRIKDRIDKFGVTSPNVFLDENTDRINVELPGVKNFERAIDLLQSSASLEFWEVTPAVEIIPALDRLNTALKGKNIQIDTTGKTLAEVDSLRKIEAAKDTANIGPLFQNAKYVNVNGDNPSGIVAVYEAGDTARVMKLIRSEEGRRLLPRNCKLLWTAKPNEDQKTKEPTNQYSLYPIKMGPGGKAPISGDMITDASANSNQTGQYTVNLTMNSEGANIWKDMTTRNVGKPVAIVLDDEVISAPNVNGAIPNGNTEITGGFTAQEASDLATKLKVGKLPARAEIVEKAIVGPSLGSSTVNAGLISILAALIAIIIFMVVYYGTAGVVAVIALLANLLFIMATLASLGTVLTLPGIAGIVLTMGMAVDANVVIYERVREDLRNGIALNTSIREAFVHSYAPLIDANVTTLLTAIILAVMGLGAIKGFGVVLAIGVISTVFTAILISQLLFDNQIEKGRKFTFSIPATENILVGKNFDFVGKRKYTYMFSGALTILGLISMFTRGFELGVDFQGGRTYTVQFAQPVETEKVADALAEFFVEDGKQLRPIVKTFNQSNTVKITTAFLQKTSMDKPDEAVKAALSKGLAKIAGKPELTQSEYKSMVLAENKVGATVADDISRSAWKTSLVALLGIFIYIFIRFRRWQYSLGAVAATFHDVFLTLTIFSLCYGFLPFSMEVDQALIAAVLTIIGYSVNDTVIVFDRLREYLNTYHNKPMSEVINDAINSTLSRTVITATTVFLVALILFLFGGPGIKGFSFAMVLGVVFGTYSSIFIATPIMYDLLKNKQARELSDAHKDSLPVSEMSEKIRNAVEK